MEYALNEYEKDFVEEFHIPTIKKQINPAKLFGNPNETITIRVSDWGRDTKVIGRTKLLFPDTEVIFNKLAKKWKEETGLYSSIHKIVTHPLYIEIQNMGWKIVPFILKDLQREPEHWFVALQFITGVDPIPEKDYGNMKRMSKAWLKWGKEQNLI
jgi:hypothetical protein